MEASYKQFIALENAIGIIETGLPASQRFYLGTGQYDTGIVFIIDLVFVIC
jgi:hypothetical protein